MMKSTSFLPSLTAEVSLYKSSGHYRSAWPAGSTSGVVPTQLGPLSVVSAPHVSGPFCNYVVEGACWASFTAIATAIAVLCTAGSVISFGGLLIPCTGVVIGSAGLAAWDAVMCTHVLQQAICT
jgi:hypothetical protein